MYYSVGLLIEQYSAEQSAETVQGSLRRLCRAVCGDCAGKSAETVQGSLRRLCRAVCGDCAGQSAETVQGSLRRLCRAVCGDCAGQSAETVQGSLRRLCRAVCGDCAGQSAETVQGGECTKEALISPELKIEWKTFRSYLPKQPKGTLYSQLTKLSIDEMLRTIFPNISTLANIKSHSPC